MKSVGASASSQSVSVDSMKSLEVETSNRPTPALPGRSPSTKPPVGRQSRLQDDAVFRDLAGDLALTVRDLNAFGIPVCRVVRACRAGDHENKQHDW